MEIPWIMLSSPTDDLSPEAFESSSYTLKLNGEFLYAKSYVRPASLERQSTKIYKTVLSEVQLQELKAMVKGIDSSAPKELLEGIVTDSSPGVLSIFEEDRIVHTYCFYDFQLSEAASDPAHERIFRIIRYLHDMKAEVL